MFFNRHKLVAIALASWHLVLGAAGYSLHVVYGRTGSALRPSR
jgi:hypothetical protein